MAEAVGTEPIVSEVRIEASPEAVFSFFTDPEKLTRWLCTEATVDPRPGGVCHHTYTGGEQRPDPLYYMRGEFVEVSPPSRLVFTWGFENEGIDVRPGASTVEVDFEPVGDATHVRLVHRDVPASERAEHDSGWNEMLARLAIAATGGDPDAKSG